MHWEVGLSGKVIGGSDSGDVTLSQLDHNTYDINDGGHVVVSDDGGGYRWLGVAQQSESHLVQVADQEAILDLPTYWHHRRGATSRTIRVAVSGSQPRMSHPRMSHPRMSRRQYSGWSAGVATLRQICPRPDERGQVPPPAVLERCVRQRLEHDDRVHQRHCDQPLPPPAEFARRQLRRPRMLLPPIGIRVRCARRAPQACARHAARARAPRRDP